MKNKKKGCVMIHVRNEDGYISKKPYADIIEHEESIIEDNIVYGYKCGYSKKEIHQYEAEALKELRALKKIIHEKPDIILILDKNTERYVVYSDC